MTHYFTPEELVQYLYNEGTEAQKATIEAALLRDWSLREKLEVLRASCKDLNNGMQSPRMSSVLNVLNYARESMTEAIPHS